MPGSKIGGRFARLCGALSAAVVVLVAAGGGQVGAASKGHSSLPRVSNGTDLAKEPVIHADKGKAPEKLEVKDLVTGTGSTVAATSTVTVKYVGALYGTGHAFTVQTWTTGHAITFPLAGVVPGFREGLLGMKVGGRREIVIPSSLGYGKSGAGATIPPNATLVFVVDLVGVKP